MAVCSLSSSVELSETQPIDPSVFFYKAVASSSILPGFSIIRRRQQRRIVYDRMVMPVTVFDDLVLNGLLDLAQLIEADGARGGFEMRFGKRIPYDRLVFAPGAFDSVGRNHDGSVGRGRNHVCFEARLFFERLNEVPGF
jgi:hypothetical protein